MLPLGMMAQDNSAFMKFFQQCSGKDGYTTINLSSELLSVMTLMADEQDERDRISSIDAIRIVVCHHPGDEEFEKGIKKLLRDPDYYQLVSSINENGKNVINLYQVCRDNKIVEFMMVATGPEPEGNCVLNITGNIQLDRLSALSELVLPPLDTLSIQTPQP